jgi:hypothetical protein
MGPRLHVRAAFVGALTLILRTHRSTRHRCGSPNGCSLVPVALQDR